MCGSAHSLTHIRSHFVEYVYICVCIYIHISTVCVCIYIYIYIYIYMHTHTHTCIHTFSHTRMQALDIPVDEYTDNQSVSSKHESTAADEVRLRVCVHVCVCVLVLFACVYVRCPDHERAAGSEVLHTYIHT